MNSKTTLYIVQSAFDIGTVLQNWKLFPCHEINKQVCLSHKYSNKEEKVTVALIRGTDIDFLTGRCMFRELRVTSEADGLVGWLQIQRESEETLWNLRDYAEMGQTG